MSVGAVFAQSPKVPAGMENHDTQEYASIKPVKSPYVLLDKLAKRIMRDDEQMHSTCGIEIKVTVKRDSMPPFSVSCKFRGEAGVGFRRMKTTEHLLCEDSMPLNKRDSVWIMNYMYILGSLSPIYAVKPNPSIRMSRLHEAISPLQGYDIATKWFNLSADEMIDTEGRRTYRLKFSRNEKKMFKELERRQEPGYITGTAYFDAETSRLLSFKGMANLSTLEYDSKLKYSAVYEEDSGTSILKQTNFSWMVGSVVMDGVVKGFELPQSQPIVTCTTQASVGSPGTLSEVLTQAQKDTCTQLKVKGALNAADVRLLRQMADGQNSTGKLSVLDLSEASFVDDKTPYMVLNAAKERLAVTAFAHKSTQEVSPIRTHTESYYTGRGRVSTIPINTRFIDVVSYQPMLYLGQDAIRKEQETSLADINFKKVGMGYVESLPNSGQYFFADSIASWEWKEIRRRKLTRFDGHELVKRKGGYFLRAYTKKDLFSHDMFYKCSRLQTVILPKGMRIDYTVKDKTSQTKYMEYDGY